MSAAAGAGDAQYRKMTQTPIPRLVATLAVPTIISMLVTAVYNMADTFFVAQLGTSAAGAVGIVFSLMAVIQAIGFMLGMGAGNLVSRYLGAKEQRQADCAASTAFFTALAFGLGITVLGTLFLDPLMRVLGATPGITRATSCSARRSCARPSYSTTSCGARARPCWPWWASAWAAC